MTTSAAPVWGIPEPTFAAAYVVVAVVLVAATVGVYRVLTDTGDRATPPDLERHPHDLAFLNGGAKLAVYSALSAMHLRDTVSAAGGVVRSAGSIEDCPNDLEQALHAAAAGSGDRVEHLADRLAVARALRSTRQRLVAGGLLMTDPRRGALRLMAVGMVVLGGVGVLWALSAVEAAAPLGLVLLVGCIALPYGTTAAALAVVGPSRTRSGNRLLNRLRAEQHELAPTMSPDWTVHGPQGAALAVGVFGTAAVWASAPALAAELGLPRTDAGDTVASGCGGCG